jgi:hypothetical protein
MLDRKREHADSATTWSTWQLDVWMGIHESTNLSCTSSIAVITTSSRLLAKSPDRNCARYCRSPQYCRKLAANLSARLFQYRCKSTRLVSRIWIRAGSTTGLSIMRTHTPSSRTRPLRKTTKWPRIRCHLAVRATSRPTHGTATQTLRRYRARVDACGSSQIWDEAHLLGVP